MVLFSSDGNVFLFPPPRLSFCLQKRRLGGGEGSSGQSQTISACLPVTAPQRIGAEEAEGATCRWWGWAVAG